VSLIGWQTSVFRFVVAQLHLPPSAVAKEREIFSNELGEQRTHIKEIIRACTINQTGKRFMFATCECFKLENKTRERGRKIRSKRALNNA
jgi:hypothetical protein